MQTKRGLVYIRPRRLIYKIGIPTPKGEEHCHGTSLLFEIVYIKYVALNTFLILQIPQIIPIVCLVELLILSAGKPALTFKTKMSVASCI